MRDLLYAARILWKKPGFTAIAALTLALGIGANSAIFSVVKGMLLFALPYPNPDDLVQVWAANARRGWDSASISYEDFQDWQRDNQTFAEMSLYFTVNLNLTGAGEPERIRGVRASANLFSVLQRKPAEGRVFLPEEDRPGADPVAIISHGFWQRRLGAAADILGKSVSLDGAPHTIVGIMPPDFYFPDTRAEVWLPHGLGPGKTERGSRSYAAVGRLKTGVRLDQARADLAGISARLAREYPTTNEGWGVFLITFRKELINEDMQLSLITLYLAVAFVLLIVCANVANLFLSRAAGREKEIAIRMALGGGRGRLLRQLLTECVLLALLGGIGGIIVGYWGTKLLLTLAPPGTPNIEWIRMDLVVLLYTIGISLLTGFIFGLAPAWQSTCARAQEALKEGGRASSGGPRHRLLKTLVVVEVALALMLLICSGLMIRGFVQRISVTPGFEVENLLTMRIWLPEFKYDRPPQRAAFFKEVLTRVRAIPGIRAAGAVQTLPLDGSNSWRGVTIEGRPAERPGDSPTAGYMIVTPDYFRAIGISLLLGRFPADTDDQAHPAAVVNQTMARRFWPNDSDPIGRRIKFGTPDSPNPWMPIVGVVADIRHQDLGTAPRPEVYVSHAQEPSRSMTLLARTEVDPLSLAGTVRQVVWSVDADQPVYLVRSMRQVIEDRTAGPRAMTKVMGVFSIFALLLAAVGVYGVVGYSVSERTHEIGIRIALGAGRGRILRMVLHQGMVLVVIGVAAGLAGALPLMRVIASLLFGVAPGDPLTYGAISALLLTVALIAMYLPARRAMGVDPLVALRYE